jgi:hypothetical protein
METWKLLCTNLRTTISSLELQVQWNCLSIGTGKMSRLERQEIAQIAQEHQVAPDLKGHNFCLSEKRHEHRMGVNIENLP